MPRKLPERALIIRPEPLEKVFAGTKTWEIRNMPTNIRGTIGLIASRSGMVLGTRELVDVKGPLRYSEFRDNARKWGGKASEVGRDTHLHYYAWVIRNAKRFRTPIPYRHPSGAIIWVKLTPEALRRTNTSR